MPQPLHYYCDRRPSLDKLTRQFGPKLQGLSQFEKYQLLAILSLTCQEIQERLDDGESDPDFTPREAEQGAYPYETTANVDFCIVSLTEDSSVGQPDFLALAEAIVTQLRHG